MSEYPEVLPPRQAFPYCCRPGCPNPAAHAELVTGIGTHVVTGAPLRRVRFLCAWHGRGHMTLADYDEQRAAEQVRARLLHPERDGQWRTYTLRAGQELVFDSSVSPTTPQIVDAKKPSR